jgi:starch synthase
MISVLAVASEMHPLIKTGGLADVVGALPTALAEHDIAVTTLIPGYPKVLEALEGAWTVQTVEDCFGGPGTLRRGKAAGLDLLVLDAPHLYDRPGNPYLGPDGRDWPDNAVRYAALSYCAAEIARGSVDGLTPQILHVHDWQAALAPAYLHYADVRRPRTIITIHNLAFQGQYPPSLLGALRLPPWAFAMDGVEYYGMIGFLKAGLNFADRITTVSPRYAAEIKTAEAGMGLEGLLASRARALSGIVNGIDDKEWNPATDPRLPVTYDQRSLDRRARNRAMLEARFALEADDAPLFCVVSRLTWQKGMDLLVEALPQLVASGARLALLGSGDRELETAFREAMAAFPRRIGAVFGYDEALSHQMFGGADMILIPSRFEPCGLTQLYGLRYGCLPVVARVGGLSDTIIDANDAALTLGAATGVQFQPVSTAMLEDAIRRAVELFRDRKLWRAMQRRGMGLDLSWRSRAGAYARLFHEVLA